MSRMRLRIAERLKESQNAAASLTTFNEIDMSQLIAMRSRFKDEVFKTHDVKLGFMSAFARASCLALKEIPAANASIEVRVHYDPRYKWPLTDTMHCRVMRLSTEIMLT